MAISAIVRDITEQTNAEEALEKAEEAEKRKFITESRIICR